MDDLKNILESLLFVAEDPLSIDRLANVLNLADRKMIRDALNELTADYEGRGGAFTLHEVAGGFQFRSRPEYVPWIKRLLQPKPSRLSKASLETLAIIAYKQPIIRSDIEHLRGVDCGGVLRMLMERKLVRVLGRKEIPGRPLIYATTKQFLEVFDLKNLRDLPTPKEIEALTQSMAEADDDDIATDGELTAEPIDLPDEDIDQDLRAAERGIPRVDEDDDFDALKKETTATDEDETPDEDEDDDEDDDDSSWEDEELEADAVDIRDEVEHDEFSETDDDDTSWNDEALKAGADDIRGEVGDDLLEADEADLLGDDEEPEADVDDIREEVGDDLPEADEADLLGDDEEPESEDDDPDETEPA